jgi:two-component system sensor histidine kinase KdpD
VYATLAVAIASIVAPILQRLPHANLSLMFMTGVLIVAVRFGLWPSIYASFLSFLVFNFFFTAPVYTFSVSEEGDLATLVFFLVMASITGNLAARMRFAVTNREMAMQRTAALQDLTRGVAGAATREQILDLLARHVAEYFDCATLAFLDQQQGSNRLFVSNKLDGPQTGEYEELWALAHKSDWSRWEVATGRSVEGLVAVRLANLTRDQSEFGAALASQAAVALDRVSLVAELESANLASERERLRAALLSSVSHDLRTPLSSIIGAASSLVAYEPTLSSDDKGALLRSVLNESERLDRYIQNLLDMTRLGQGDLKLQLDWEDIRDLVSVASRRLGISSRNLKIEMDVASDARFIHVHGDLIEQVFVNLLDNAARHSPPGGIISVRAWRDSDAVFISVADEGPGIPADVRDRVFEPFYRVQEKDSKSGTGLGLSICRGIVRAHGGDIVALAPAGKSGAVLRLYFPQRVHTPPGAHDA